MTPGADAQSKETTLAGLPKAIKLTIPGNQQTTILNAQTLIVYNVVEFNYGGYVLKPSVVYGIAFYEGIIIPEPGIYAAKASAAQLTGAAQTSQLFIAVNGVVTLPDGTTAKSGQSNAAIAGAPPALEVEAPLQLRAGDVVGAIWVTLNANPDLTGPSTWLYVEKKGGNYGV